MLEGLQAKLWLVNLHRLSGRMNQGRCHFATLRQRLGCLQTPEHPERDLVRDDASLQVQHWAPALRWAEIRIKFLEDR